MSSLQHSVQNNREDYEKDSLSEDKLPANPLELFENWLNLAFSNAVPEPIAMNLATVNKDGKPSSRVVLLRGFDEKGFVFYTNYRSRKGTDINANPFAALCFYWYELNKQIRIEGKLDKVPAEVSDTYFSSRPRLSQLGAWASEQSTVVKSRKDFEDRLPELEKKFNDVIPRPPYWGGYALSPERIEFWQGRASRLHDRIEYIKNGSEWKLNRLAP